MKTWLLIGIAATILLTSACSSNSTFLVLKDGQSTFIGSDSQVKYDLLCASGELEKVLADTHLETSMKYTFFKYNCSVERSSERVKQIFATLTVEQRRDIKSAFRKNGYEINHIFC